MLTSKRLTMDFGRLARRAAGVAAVAVFLCGLGLGTEAEAASSSDAAAEYETAFNALLGELKVYVDGANLAESAIRTGDYVTGCAIEQSLPARLSRLDELNKVYRKKAKANKLDPDSSPAHQEVARALARYHSDIPSFNYNYCGKDPAAKLAELVSNMRSAMLSYDEEVPRHLDLARSFYQQDNLLVACAEIGQADNNIAGANLVMPKLIGMNPRVQAFSDAELQDMAARFADWASTVTPLHQSYCEAKDRYVAARQAEEEAQRNAQLAAEQAANEERRRQMASQGVQSGPSAGQSDDFNSRMQAWCDSHGASNVQFMAAVPPVCFAFVRGH